MNKCQVVVFGLEVWVDLVVENPAGFGLVDLGGGSLKNVWSFSW